MVVGANFLWKSGVGLEGWEVKADAYPRRFGGKRPRAKLV
jgi:hypothetical protein